MSNINLLPWREARAQRQKKQFGALLGIFVLVTVALGFFANWLEVLAVTGHGLPQHKYRRSF